MIFANTITTTSAGLRHCHKFKDTENPADAVCLFVCFQFTPQTAEDSVGPILFPLKSVIVTTEEL